MDELIKTLNGVQLTEGQALTLRVALESFAGELQRDGLGDDEHGRALTRGYLARIEDLRRIIYRDVRNPRA